MLQLIDICEYIKSKINVGDSISAALIDESRKCCIGVYDNNKQSSSNITLGGLSQSRHGKTKISILVHWEDYAEAETKAKEVYNLFYGKSDVMIKDNHIAFFIASNPVPLGYSGDIFEFVVPIEIIYNK